MVDPDDFMKTAFKQRLKRSSFARFDWKNFELIRHIQDTPTTVYYRPRVKFDSSILEEDQVLKLK